jgi:AAHS family 4-hydroxybenzoate transporter-like MFS transporter
LPESLKFLVARRPGDRRIGGLLARLAPDVEPGSVFAAPRTAKKRSLFDLLNADYRARTAVLWTLYALNIFVIYMLVSWLPTLLRRAGWPTDEALVGSVLFQLGGVAGGLVLSSFIDRGRMRGALIVGYATCAVALAAIAFTPSTFLIWGALMLAVGAGISGSQFVLVALAAEFYPLTIRATGVGWAVTVGRVGAVAAPLVGGAVLPLVTPVNGLTLLMIPALICAACSVLVRREWREG